MHRLTISLDDSMAAEIDAFMMAKGYSSRSEAMRDLGALPHDADLEAVIHDLRLDQPTVDPTTLSDLDRRILKEALRLARTVQQRLEIDHHA